VIVENLEELVIKLKPWLAGLAARALSAGVGDGRFSGGLWIGAMSQTPVAGSLCLEGSILKSRALSARLGSNASKSIPHATWTALTFNTEIWDEDELHSLFTNADRLTIRTAGVYLITAQVRFAANMIGTRELQIRLNGSTTLALADCQATAQANGLTYLNLVTLWKLMVGDYLSTVVYQTSGVALSVESAGAFSPAFMAARIA
jgi:hypothetical protein